METSHFTFAQNLFQWGEFIGTSIKRTFFNPTYSFSFLTATLNKETFLNVVVNVKHFPQRYRTWWIKLVREDPVHVFIETALIAFVVYLMLFTQINNSGGNAKKEKKKKNKTKDDNKADDINLLTEAEKEELIRDWKPAPLAPPLDDQEQSDINSSINDGSIVIHKVEGTRLIIQDKFSSSSTRVVLNMASHDFLGMGSSEPAVKEVSKAALMNYGCGSCGPRGFYGTIDVHLDLERYISQFCGTDDAIMYSDGASAATSVVAAFAKRGDLLIVDEGVYEALQTGVTVSRANVVYFRHNDMNDLRRVLQQIRETDSKIGRKPADQRRFIVVEGLYKNYGNVCPMDELVAIKKQFSYRLIVDESFSFGSLGATGRGVIELYNKKIMDDAEIVIISLENSLGSIGGVCVGNFQVVDHQRLSGAGYCYSASAPPFVAVAAIESLAKLERSPEILQTLARNRKALYQGLRDLPEIDIISDERSSIAFIRLADRSSLSEDEEEVTLGRIALHCLQEGVLIISTCKGNDFLRCRPPPSLKMTVTSGHTEDEIQKAVNTLRMAVKAIVY